MHNHLCIPESFNTYKNLILPAFRLQNCLCELTTREHKFKKRVLNFNLKYFWYTKINLRQKYILNILYYI